MNNDELKHYGVLGMKWGKRRAQALAKKYKDKAKIADDSANEWAEMSSHAQAKGNRKLADKYAKNAADDYYDSMVYKNAANKLKNTSDRKTVSQLKRDVNKMTTGKNRAGTAMKVIGVAAVATLATAAVTRRAAKNNTVIGMFGK